MKTPKKNFIHSSLYYYFYPNSLLHILLTSTLTRCSFLSTQCKTCLLKRAASTLISALVRPCAAVRWDGLVESCTCAWCRGPPPTAWLITWWSHHRVLGLNAVHLFATSLFVGILTVYGDSFQGIQIRIWPQRDGRSLCQFLCEHGSDFQRNSQADMLWTAGWQKHCSNRKNDWDFSLWAKTKTFNCRTKRRGSAYTRLCCGLWTRRCHCCEPVMKNCCKTQLEAEVSWFLTETSVLFAASFGLHLKRGLSTCLSFVLQRKGLAQWLER